MFRLDWPQGVPKPAHQEPGAGQQPHQGDPRRRVPRPGELAGVAEHRAQQAG